MTQITVKIFEEIKHLSEDERAELIEMINDNFRYAVDPEIEKAWADEAERRYDNYKKNGGITYTMDEVFKSVVNERNK